MGQELELMEKFLGMRKLERGGPYYKSPKTELTSHVFEHLIYNLKLYNGIKI